MFVLSHPECISSLSGRCTATSASSLLYRKLAARLIHKSAFEMNKRQGRPWHTGLTLACTMQVVIFDNDMDEELLLIQERAAEAIAAVVQEGPKACAQACAIPWDPASCSRGAASILCTAVGCNY